MSIEIRTATTDELEDVWRFRYSLAVSEMRLDPEDADHKRKMIYDSLDADGKILAAFDEENRVVGTVCLNFAPTGLGEWVDHFRMEGLGSYYPRRVSMTTKLMVASAYRATTLRTRLLRAGFRRYYEAGVCFDNVRCQPRHRAYFEQLGYRQVFPNFTISGHGEFCPMLLVLGDRSHLEEVNSPFLPILPDRLVDHGSVDYFYDKVLPATGHSAETTGVWFPLAALLRHAA
jgi:hypothetical protein